MYVKISNGEIFDFGAFRELFPNVSFTADGPDDEFLAGNGFARLTGDDTPDLLPGQYAVPTNTAHLVGGQWFRIVNVEGSPVSPDPGAPSETILRSPNGTHFKITIDDDGKIESEPLGEV